MTSNISWEELSPQLEKNCFNSQIFIRIEFLKDLQQLIKTETLEAPQLGQISATLLRTYVSYTDSNSKALVKAMFHNILDLEPRLYEKYIAFILEQVSKSTGSRAIVDYLNLLEWIHEFVIQLSKNNDLFTANYQKLFEAHCLISYSVELALDNQEINKKINSKRNQHRNRVRRSTLQATTKTLAIIFNQGDNKISQAEQLISFILEKYGIAKLPISGVVVLMGAITQSFMQLSSSKPAFFQLLKEKYVTKYCEFIGKEVILAKVPPSPFCLELSLKPFIHEFVDEELFNTHFVPNIEKANLRAPEVGFITSTEIFAGINLEKVNLLHFFVTSKLMTQTFSSLKSSKEGTKNAAINSMSTLLRSLDSKFIAEEDLVKFVNEVFKNIKTNLNADYKIIASNILKCCPVFSQEVSLIISKGLNQYISKETNEAALIEMLSAFFLNYTHLENSTDDFDKTINEGLSNKKPSLRKIWCTSFLSNSENASLKTLENNEKDTLEFLKETLSHNQNLDHNAAFSCLQYIVHVLNSTSKELKTNALEVIRNLENKRDLGNAMTIISLSTTLKPTLRMKSITLLETLFKLQPELLGLSVVEALKYRIITNRNNEEDSISYKFCTPLFSAISQPIDDKAALEKVIIAELFIAEYEQFHLKNGWAGLALHAAMDPSAIIKNKMQTIMDILNVSINDKEIYESNLRDCILKSIAYTCFINPDVAVPFVINFFQDCLVSDQLSKYKDEDFTIWSGEEGTMVIDVLEKKNAKQLSNKNTKDYETLKWEQKVRKEQSKKTVKKYTKEEKVLVDEQLAKEASIRLEIDNIIRRLTNGITVIGFLSNQAKIVDNGSGVWFPSSVSALLSLIREKNCSRLLRQKALDVFLTLSENISERLGGVKLYIGVAILRIYKVSNIPENLLAEPLDELLSRVLFRIKFVANQAALDAVSLAYLLPLLINVLEEGKRVALKNADKPVARTESVEEDKEEEHLMLAMEIISVHAEVFEDPSIPRAPIMNVLMSLLGLASKAKIAKDCLNVLCQSISVAPTDADLEILLNNLLSPNPFVRSTILEIIDNEFELETNMKNSAEVFICRFDSEANNREVADFIWEFSKFIIDIDLLRSLISLFNQDDSGLRLFTARAYAAASLYLEKENSDSLKGSLDMLTTFYKEKAAPLEAIMDEFGLVAVAASERKDPWQDRSTAAIALKELSSGIPEDDSYVVDLVKFLIEDGPLGDRELIVRQEMKEAGIEIITLHGAKKSEELIPIFEYALTSNIETTVKENVIILYGTLARHLEAHDARIETIIHRLLSSLDTPSADVQQAISECIGPLVFQFREKVGDYITDLMNRLLDPSLPVAIRKGSAWGIAGLVKGYGIQALSEFDIIRNLIEASEDKKLAVRRESVAYAFEYLSKSLKKFFEPYVIEVLPNILKNLGDAVPEVRNATADATKAIMAYTTSFGVTKLIPVAVSNLDEISWRTKRGSVELLGNMAYLDPAQLSASLSTIVPEIVGVLNDSHKEVRKAADESLNRFGEVIRNPEIQKLVPTLINAIGDPTKHTEDALDALINTQFVHYIDGPSLALIIHVIHRGMHERSANTKRKACKIVGNMAILVDIKDLIPYLQQLVDEVEVAMVDPVPNTRATAARALGALVERLGEEQFPDLIPRLIDTLSDETKSGDRLGSAQALAEVMSGLGLAKLDELLPTILAGVSSYRAYVREGYMPLLLFIPICYGAQFAPYINQIIQPILGGLADTDEDIHDTALKAGKLIVKKYASKAIDLLLPELEKGMFNANERIRLSSVQLSGELLFQVTGISSRNEFSEEEGDHSGEFANKLVEVLGQDRRDRVLASLFVCRNDTSGIVRASTVDIWKALVPNTPRAVKEILPTLTGMIVGSLASTSASLRNIAAQTLGDLVRRVGGNALSQLLPTLYQSIQESATTESRQGVCIALNELIESSSAETLDEFQEIIVKILRETLIDSDVSVRQAAAGAFDSYQDIVGSVAIDEILPHMLHMLESEESSQNALLGLQDIMSTKSEVIFPILIPTLLAPPIDSFRASALGSLAEVAGPSLYKRLSTIINALVDSLINVSQDDEKTALENSLDKVFLSVTDEEGCHPLLQQIMALLKHDDHKKRLIILERLPNFFEKTNLDFDLYIPDFVSNAILSLDDKDPRVVKGNFEALTTLIKKQDKSMLERLVKPAKQSLQMVGKQGEDLGAFTLPRGPNCVLPIFLHGLMYGSNDEREASALAIADIVSKTPAANLKPFVSVITGPLIRVVGERFSSDIKAAILFALNILFVKIPQFLRPFIPQLQRTFVKSLSDASNETLRLRAAKALGTLIEYQPRVDPLIIELVGGAKQATDEGVKTAMLKALLEVVSKAGSKLNENSKKNIVNLVEEEMLVSNDKLAVAYAKLIGSLSDILTEEEAKNILTEKVLSVELSGDSGKFAILTVNSFLKDAPGHIINAELIDKFIPYIVGAIESTDIYFTENGIIAAGKMLLLEGETKSPFSKQESSEPLHIGEENIKQLIECLSRCTLKPVSNSTDARRLSLVVIRTLARFKMSECIQPFIDTLAISVFSCLRDSIIPIKLAAEKAYLAIFNLIDEVEMDSFTEWFNNFSANTVSVENLVGTTVQMRSIGDYTKRVGKRLANVERERIAAGGDAETMFSDRFEDEKEIWSVGGVELNNDA